MKTTVVIYWSNHFARISAILITQLNCELNSKAMYTKYINYIKQLFVFLKMFALNEFNEMWRHRHNGVLLTAQKSYTLYCLLSFSAKWFVFRIEWKISYKITHQCFIVLHNTVQCISILDEDIYLIALNAIRRIHILAKPLTNSFECITVWYWHNLRLWLIVKCWVHVLNLIAICKSKIEEENEMDMRLNKNFILYVIPKWQYHGIQDMSLKNKLLHIMTVTGFIAFMARTVTHIIQQLQAFDQLLYRFSILLFVAEKY